MRYDTIILGAGPAGLTAAYHASRGKARVLVLEKASRPGAKLSLAGGGKGNLTNRHVTVADYIGENPGFAAPVLERVPPEAVIAALRAANIPLEERDQGRIFCTTSARAVLNFLLARLAGADRETPCAIRTETAVTGIRHADGLFTVSCADASFTAPRCILATGGPAWPQCGADASGLRLARELGHRIAPPRPALVPFVMPETWPLTGLAGISLPVRITCDAPDTPCFTDSLLFTHRGVSGPAALQISCWWRKGAALHIDFLPGENASRMLDAATGKATPLSLFSRRLPERLIAALLDPALARRRVAELSRAQRDALATALHRHSVTPSRTEGLAHAEASAGGVDVAGIDPMTLQSRLVPGLFFCGEIVDITGRLGGYNLHWAWASGHVAGEAAAGC